MKTLNFEQLNQVSGGNGWTNDLQMFGVGAGLSLGGLAGLAGAANMATSQTIGAFAGSAYGAAAFATVGMVGGVVGFGGLGFTIGLGIDIYSHFSQWRQSRHK